MFDGLKDMGKLLKQAKEMKSKMKEVQEYLKKATVQGSSRDRNFLVTLTGELECVKIDVVNPTSDAKAIAKGMQEAFNDAAQKAKQLAASQLQAVSGDLNLPDL